MKMKNTARRPVKPPVSGSFPCTLVPTVAPVWTTAGLTHIESVTNFQVYFPSIDKTVGIWVLLPAGYTAGTFQCATIRFGHGAQTYPSGGAGVFSDTLPPAYNDAVQQGVLTTKTLMYGYHGGEYPMDTNTPTGVPMETIALLVHEWIHANYYTYGLDYRYNYIAGFSMCGRGAFYLFNKYAKLYSQGNSAWCWGGVTCFGPPVYDENHNYAGNGAITSWSIPCISPASTWTATELSVWASKTGQYWLDAAATANKPITVVYGSNDPVYAAAGSTLATRLAATPGLMYDFSFGVLGDTGNAISHDPDLYFQALTTITRPKLFAKAQAVFNGI